MASTPRIARRTRTGSGCESRQIRVGPGEEDNGLAGPNRSTSVTR